MLHFRRWLVGISVILLLAASTRAQEPIRFARTPDISPDGKTVAFSYFGDIWTVEAIGGIARRVTVHEAHEINPVFSPDGRQIAFSSNRHGSYDLFTVPVQGGEARRLTYDSSADYPSGWSPDGKTVLFSSTRSTDFPFGQELYSVPAAGGRETRITYHEGREGVFSPQGDRIAYVRGPGTWFRKGYRGSSNDDIWICDARGNDNRRLTTCNCQDTSPMWSPDGKYLYYVTECATPTANIVRQPVEGKDGPIPLTFHKEDPVRKARISAHGDWIVYECGADIWVVSTKTGSPPRKLAIEVNTDDKVNPERTVSYSRDATEYALSFDEKHLAYVVHGEIFLTTIPPAGKTIRLTNSPAFDHGIAWAPDSSKMVFLSDRDGHENLYLLEAAESGKKIPEVTQFKVKQLTQTPEGETSPGFSPDGKRVAFLRAGKLWTMNPDGSDQKAVVATPEVIDYEWSPDSRWLAFARLDNSFASEIYIIPGNGNGEARNVTRYATSNIGITWSKDMRLAFLGERRGALRLLVMNLQKPAAPGAASSSDIDWEDVHQRVSQPAPLSAQEGAISPDGNKVAFRSLGVSGPGKVEGDLWVANTDGSQLTRVTTGNMLPQQIQWSRRYPDVIYFRDGTGTFRMAKVGLTDLQGGRGGTPTVAAAAIPIKAKLVVHREQEFLEIFDQSWRALSEGFYDSKFHGVDWNALREKYRPLVKHCVHKEDLYALVSLLMGELNASHLEISGFIRAPEEVTASLGLIFDETYRGPGMKIKEVLKRGPADKRGLNLKPGELIVTLDDNELTDKVNLSKLLNDKIGETVSLQVVPANANPADVKARRKVDIQAVARREIALLMYDRWVENNAQRVHELSQGKLGYIHIPTMDEAGLDRFVRSLYSDNLDKEAIVLDVRFNGGGHTHDQVLNYLGGREHTLFRPRHGGEGQVLRSTDRKWTKPLVLLINNQSYSDAEIFPNAFKTLGLGKTVGEPTGGMVIGTTSIQLIDGSNLRVPRTGVYTLEGRDLENAGVTPDVLVEQHPDQLTLGRDAQLEKAVEVLKLDVAQWKAKRGNGSVVASPESGKSASPPASTNPPPGK